MTVQAKVAPKAPPGEPPEPIVEIDDVVRLILEGAAGCRIWVTKEQKRAAELLAKILDSEAVDKICDLPAGQVRTWFHEDERFRSKVIESRASYETSKDPVSDLSAALSERQRRAAEMLATGRRTTVEVPRELEITDRTIRNWKKTPTFQIHLQALRDGEAWRRDRARNESEELLRERLGAVTLSAVNSAESELQAGQRQGGGRAPEGRPQHHAIAEVPAGTGRNRKRAAQTASDSRRDRSWAPFVAIPLPTQGIPLPGCVAGIADLGVRRFLPPRPGPGR